MKAAVAVVVLVALATPVWLAAEEAEPATGKQCIVWSSGDRDVALNMVFMYTYNAKKRGWMADVRLLVWGPSAQLLAVDRELQEQLAILKEQGVELLACKACADGYGVAEDLEKLGVTVKYTGKLLADMQKDGWHVLTF